MRFTAAIVIFGQKRFDKKKISRQRKIQEKRKQLPPCHDDIKCRPTIQGPCSSLCEVKLAGSTSHFFNKFDAV